LTEGKPRLAAVEPIGGLTADDLLLLAASVERGSEHPLAAAIVQGAAERHVQLSGVHDVQSATGKGITGSVQGRKVTVGNARLMSEQQIPSDRAQARMEQMGREGQTVMLIAVDGRPVDPLLGPAPLLAGTVGKPVELGIRPKGADPEVRRRVVVVPLRDERRLRYQDWVAGRRRLVRELGDGRIGYLHIPNMVGEGWADLHRDLRTEMGFDALVMDVRGNGGGHISQLVVEKLARRVIGWDHGRWIRPSSYPQDGRRGPVVTVADEFAGSDGDIVTAAIKLLGLGPVVGTRTWGGVVGIDGVPGHELVDGTHMTVPRYAFSFDEYGWGVENYGVEPDVEVLFTPDDWAAGHDPQLETAVRLVLEALEKQPPKVPADPSTGPSRVRPPLPPRAARASRGTA